MDDAALAARAVADGRIDMVGLARPLLADPDYANKILAGREEDVRPCICCHMGCFGRSTRGLDLGCAVNAAAGREEAYALTRAEKPKRVLIVGGGLAGMEAARVCALRGHAVALCERGGALGGVFTAAASPACKEADRRLLAWYHRQLAALDIEVRLSTEVTAAAVDDPGWEAVLLATGARECVLRVPGLEAGRCLSAKDYMQGGHTGARLLVVGGGLTGAEIARDAARRGKTVTLIEAADTVLNVEGLCAANYNMLLDLLDYHGVERLTGTVLYQVCGETARLRRTLRNYPNEAGRCAHYTAIGPKGREEALERPVDTVVAAIGSDSDRALYNRAAGDGRVRLLGDAAGVGNVLSAIWGAYEAAMEL